jgi:hypothetical protein
MPLVLNGLDNLPPKDSEETAQEELAQIAIDLIRAEAASDDQLNHPNYNYHQYLQATTAALSKIIGSIDNMPASLT